MKKLVIIPLILLIVSCSVKEKPTFVNVENINVKEATLETITLTADASFLNPNITSGTLECKGIEVYVNDVLMTNVTTEAFDVPAYDEFKIPLTVVIPTKKVLEENQNGVIGGILNSLLKKKVKVQYKGVITYKALGFSYDYPVDKTQDVKIKF